MREPFESLMATSRTVTLLEAGLDRGRAVASASQVVAPVGAGGRAFGHAWRGSGTETGLLALRDLVGRSTVGRVSSRISRWGAEHGSRAVSTARVRSIGEWSQRKTRQSFLYSWLTADPDPEVIVIDLRETYTAGPVIAGLDRAIASVLPGMTSSTVTEEVRAGAAVIRQRPLRYLGGVGVILVGLSLCTTTISGSATPLVVGIHVILSVLFALGLRSKRTWDELVAHPVVQWLAGAFEPPEPIEPARDEDNKRG